MNRSMLNNIFSLCPVSFSYCIDAENRNIGKSSTSGGSRRDNNSSGQSDTQSMYAGNYQYTLSDVPKLAEQAAVMYAQTPAEKESYLAYYTDYYTKQVNQVMNK